MKYRLAIMLLALVGCAQLAKYEEPTNKVLETTEVVAAAVDPVTNGWAGLVAGVASTLAGLVFGVNRAILAKKQGEAIKEIDANPATPSAAAQVTGAAAQKVINKIVG